MELTGEMVCTQIGPALCCVSLAVADFRRRRVPVVWLALLGVVALTAGLCSAGSAVAGRVAGNVLILGLLGMSVGLYLRWRYGKVRGRWRYFLGAGDAWFVGALTPLFAPEAFLRFLVASCLAALGWYLFLRPRRRRTIPFVGVAGATFVGFTLIQWLRVWLA